MPKSIRICWRELCTLFAPGNLFNNNLFNMGFNTKDDLWDALDKAFKEVKPDYVKRLYGSVVRRLTSVLAANGGHTKY